MHDILPADMPVWNLLEGEYRTAQQQHTHIEPHVCITYWDEDGRLVVRTSTQVPFHIRRMLAPLIGLPVKINQNPGNGEEPKGVRLVILIQIKYPVLNRTQHISSIRREERVPRALGPFDDAIVESIE